MSGEGKRCGARDLSVDLEKVPAQTPLRSCRICRSHDRVRSERRCVWGLWSDGEGDHLSIHCQNKIFAVR